MDFSGFSYFFPEFFQLFRCGWGAVLWISAVSATFSGIFPAVSLGLMCTQCQGHLVFYFPNIWTLSFMEFQDSYNEFCRIKKFVQ